ncbi:MAG: hypothetical protein KBT28_12065 [Bacteroidales bacterium]|nr:hypothetical protein [Candidatus Colimorpha merdihippi]
MIKRIFNYANGWITSIFGIATTILAFFEACGCVRCRVFAICVSLSAIVIIASLLYYCCRRQYKCRHNGINIKVVYGDLFAQKGLKVIPVNEYFDTLVDVDCVSENSLHGAFLKKHNSSIGSIQKAIEEDSHLKEAIVSQEHQRIKGNTMKYKLGSSVVFEDYLLYSFTHFDRLNHAHISLAEYYENMVRLWEEINDRYNACTQVSVPLFGAGITRFDGGNCLSKQHMLQIMLLTLKQSRCSFCSGFTLQIVLHESVKNDINLNELD